MYVYLIEAPLVGRLKIGTAVSLERRFGSIQSSSPCPLVLLGSFLGSYAEERQLHRQFAEYRSHGEWFTDCPAIREELAKRDSWLPYRAPPPVTRDYSARELKRRAKERAAAQRAAEQAEPRPAPQKSYSFYDDFKSEMLHKLAHVPRRTYPPAAETPRLQSHTKPTQRITMGLSLKMR